MVKQKIKEEDIHNMDEKDYAVGLIGKARVIISREERKGYIIQDGSREWVSILECIYGRDYAGTTHYFQE